jgi:hypothetical protein
VEATNENLGYFAVGPEPKSFEIVALREMNSAMQCFALGLPTWINKESGLRHPDVGFGGVEITGPLIDQWPPERHTRLLGDMDLKTGTLADAERILQGFIPRAFRRPAVEAEVARYAALRNRLLDEGRSFEESLRNVWVGVLCSPHFIYLHEELGRKLRADTELAWRLSYFLWSTSPDDEVLAVAADQPLGTPKVLHAQVERLLKSPKSVAFVQNFTGQMSEAPLR